jgi:menaquinone-9 beta-reductase
MSFTETNVVIIGAGPAGVGTSIYLSLNKIPHIILEKDQFPRDKVCGDAVSGKSAFVLRKANPDWLKDIFQQPDKYHPSQGITFIAPNGKSLNIPYGDNLKPGELAPGFTSPRLVFDQFLFEKIDRNYATVYENASIKSIEKVQGGNKIIFSINDVPQEITASIIVGADGDKGITRKTFLNADVSSKAYAVGLRAYYKGLQITDKNYIELHFLKEMLPGYFWIFPLPNGMANVGVGILSERIRSRKINLREQMLKAIEENPSINYRFKDAELIGKIQGWGLPMGMKRQAISGNNFLMTGDAASLIDPFSGEGIGNALYSGMLAAEAIKKAIEMQDFSSSFLKGNYDDVLYRRLGPELKISATLQRLCQYPWLFNMVVNKAYKSESLSKTISSMFTDLDLRDQLRRPSFYAKILFNR